MNGIFHTVFQIRASSNKCNINVVESQCQSILPITLQVTISILHANKRSKMTIETNIYRLSIGRLHARDQTSSICAFEKVADQFHCFRIELNASDIGFSKLNG